MHRFTGNRYTVKKREKKTLYIGKQSNNNEPKFLRVQQGNVVFF
jgi:hypothetical protein